MNLANRSIEFRGGAVGATVPLLFFTFGALYLGLSGAPDERGFWVIAVAALTIGLLLAKSGTEYSDAVIAGMADSVVAVMVVAWLLSGAIGQLVREGGAVNALVQLFSGLGVGPGFFVCGVFLVAAVVGTSTGTAVGTVLITTPVLFPVGVALGASPFWILGAILGGGAFGDDFSPLSDTTIASAKTQHVDIGASVSSRIKYALTAGGIALGVFFVGAGSVGSRAVGSSAGVGDGASMMPLVLLFGPALVVLLCFLRVHLVAALLWGIVVSAFMSISFNVLPASAFFEIDRASFSAKSVIIDGMAKGVGISIFSILLVGLVRAVLAGGVVDVLLRSRFVRALGEAKAEMGIVGATLVLNSLLAHNTITILALGDVVNAIGRNENVSGLRRANLLDLAGNTVMHIFPYMITVILATSLARSAAVPSVGDLPAWRVGLYNAHSWALLGVVVVCAVTGLWREKDRELSIGAGDTRN